MAFNNMLSQRELEQIVGTDAVRIRRRPSKRSFEYPDIMKQKPRVRYSTFKQITAQRLEGMRHAVAVTFLKDYELAQKAAEEWSDGKFYRFSPEILEGLLDALPATHWATTLPSERFSKPSEGQAQQMIHSARYAVWMANTPDDALFKLLRDDLQQSIASQAIASFEAMKTIPKSRYEAFDTKQIAKGAARDSKVAALAGHGGIFYGGHTARSLPLAKHHISISGMVSAEDMKKRFSAYQDIWRAAVLRSSPASSYSLVNWSQQELGDSVGAIVDKAAEQVDSAYRALNSYKLQNYPEYAHALLIPIIQTNDPVLVRKAVSKHHYTIPPDAMGELMEIILQDDEQTFLAGKQFPDWLFYPVALKIVERMQKSKGYSLRVTLGWPADDSEQIDRHALMKGDFSSLESYKQTTLEKLKANPGYARSDQMMRVFSG